MIILLHDSFTVDKLQLFVIKNFLILINVKNINKKNLDINIIKKRKKSIR